MTTKTVLVTGAQQGIGGAAALDDVCAYCIWLE